MSTLGGLVEPSRKGPRFDDGILDQYEAAEHRGHDQRRRGHHPGAVPDEQKPSVAFSGTSTERNASSNSRNDSPMTTPR
jgi:hypothetical protein